MYECTACPSIHGTLMISNMSPSNNVTFFVTDLRIVYNNSYNFSNTILWTKE